MLKKFFIIVSFVLCTFCQSFAQSFSSSMSVYAEEKRFFFQLGTGMYYDFDIGSEFFANSANRIFFDVPLFFEADFRLLKNFAINTGISFNYNLEYYIDGEYDIYKNSLFIDVPLNFKFYPLAKKDERFDSFYIGAGLFFRAWAVNTYAAYSDDETYYGNAYEPNNDVVAPGECFVPVNVGVSMFLGNVLRLNQQTGLGVEISLKYAFIPYENGFLAIPNYCGTSGNTLLSFWGDVGMRFFVQFLLNNKAMEYRY